jgi:hypothetical protein
MNERERRVGLNEAVFRQVNERIRDLSQGLGHEDRRLELVCECGDASCDEKVTVEPDEYERVRSDSKNFIVYKGHVDTAVEEVIDSRRGYDVVRKLAGEAAKVAEQTNPRD